MTLLIALGTVISVFLEPAAGAAFAPRLFPLNVGTGLNTRSLSSKLSTFFSISFLSFFFPLASSLGFSSSVTRTGRVSGIWGSITGTATSAVSDGISWTTVTFSTLRGSACSTTCGLTSISFVLLLITVDFTRLSSTDNSLSSSVTFFSTTICISSGNASSRGLKAFLILSASLFSRP